VKSLTNTGSLLADVVALTTQPLHRQQSCWVFGDAHTSSFAATGCNRTALQMHTHHKQAAHLHVTAGWCFGTNNTSTAQMLQLLHALPIPTALLPQGTKVGNVVNYK
jgi:hypothetical protein